VFERFTDRARRVVVLAQEEARALNHNYIGTEHILLGLIHEGEGVAAKAMEELGISLEAVRQQVEEIIGLGQQAPAGHIPFTPRAKKVLELSLREALQLGHNYVGTEHILLGLIREGEGVAAQVLVKMGADLNRVRQQVIQLLSGYQSKDQSAAEEPSEAAPATFSAAKDQSAAEEPSEAAPATFSVLDSFGRCLTAEAREGKLDPVVGRRTEIAQITQALMLRTRNSAMLVGEPGVGKTVLAEGLAQHIVKGEVPKSLRNIQLYALDLAALVAGSRHWTDFEERLNGFREEVGTRDDIVLFIDEIHTLTGAGTAEGTFDAASVLKMMLAQRELRVIATATPAEYQRYQERDVGLERRFQLIQVTEPTVAQTIEILDGLRDRYEAHHRISIPDAVLVTVAELADRHLPDRPLPGKAIDLLDLAGAQVRIRTVTPTPEPSELNEKIAGVRRDKESAIDAQDFVKAAALRDTEKGLLNQKRQQELEIVPEVAVADVEGALAVISGGSPAHIAHVRQSRRRTPVYAPTSMTSDDKAIWAMS
jgi:ATP-dependent Clp protease ATP-binding subunit ClpC